MHTCTTCDSTVRDSEFESLLSPDRFLAFGGDGIEVANPARAISIGTHDSRPKRRTCAECSEPMRVTSVCNVRALMILPGTFRVICHARKTGILNPVPRKKTRYNKDVTTMYLSVRKHLTDRLRDVFLHQHVHQVVLLMKSFF
jgi:hypothetical protein